MKEEIRTNREEMKAEIRTSQAKAHTTLKK
jgi:hypothetical protein